MRSAIKICAVLFVLGALWQTAPRVESRTAQTEPSREGVEFFEKRIRPLLDSQCLACHGAKTPAGGLRLDTREGLLKGGNSGQSVILPGDPERSLLIKAIRYNDAKLQMPPTGRLSPEQIADFETWIRIGAPDPRRGAAAIAAVDPVYDFKEASKFWSFRPVRNQEPPAVRNAAWARTPIDRFILARLEAKGLRPVADADRRTLLRRAT
jgi:hypothetical protein